jgi:alpha-mannosidase
MIELRGEMHPHAIGCYSAHSELKQLNRRAENALLAAEKLCFMAEAHTHFRANWDALRQGWKNVCFNQFHDILGGVAIKEACDDAINMYREAIAIADREKRLAIQSAASRIDTRGDGEAIIVFNPKAFDSEEEFAIELWHPHASELGEVLEHLRVVDEHGKEVIVQRSRPSGKIGGDRTRFISRAVIPALGWRTFYVQRHVKSTVGELLTFDKKRATAITGLEVQINEKARPQQLESTYLYHVAEVYHDSSDTWGHGIKGFTELAGRFKLQSIEEIAQDAVRNINPTLKPSIEETERGPIYRIKRITSTYNASKLVEEYKIGWKGDVMDVAVTLDWREQNAIAKLRFDHLCEDPTVTYEIPYAAIERPPSDDEHPGQSWVHVKGKRNGSDFGIALINDAKYSYSVTERSIYLTLARSPLYAHHVPPHVIEEGERLEYLDQGIQSFNVRLVFNCPNWPNARLHEHSGQLHRPVIAHYESAHEGTLPKSYRGASTGDPRIEDTALKRAENGQGVVARVVNRSNESVGTSLDLALLGASGEFSFRPFEVKTLRLIDGDIQEISAIET